ncbi:unnamed protein product [Trifolium pratense]|uniref:Uncharacterized protein n=1 Tax=Trifolium pratense TaxID=57577 RepID=A0ACB0L6B6_TRIPR|nr:unnamed protein product [Trifolium pratense]
MAVAPYTTVSTPRVHSPPSVFTKLYSGLKLQSQHPFAASSISSNAQFFGKVHKALNSRYGNKKSVRAQFFMMPMGTPRVAYRTPGERTYQWVDLWNALYRERIIFIGQNINEEFSNQILATMLYLDTVDNKEKLYLFINGLGGDLTPCMALYDTMQSLQSPIATHCLGQAYNLAAFLLAAGDKVAIVVQCLLQELLSKLQEELLVVGLMTCKMKQMNFLESEITFTVSWLAKQAILLRRLSKT